MSPALNSAKPENGTVAIRSRITPLQFVVAYSISLRINPSINNFALVTGRTAPLHISSPKRTGTSLHCVKKTSLNTLLISLAGG